MSDPVRIAVIGAGAFGTLHAETLAAMDAAHLVAIVDPHLDRARELATRLSVPQVFGGIEELVAANVVEAVVIATRADSHLRIASLAAAAGLHVFVEKPLANSAEEIRQYARKHDPGASVLMVDHLALFHSLVRPLLKCVQTRGFRAIHCVRHRPDAIGRHFPDDHPIQLVMIHDLYVVARMAAGEEPVEFRAMDARNREGRTDMSWASLRWADGRVATFQCHMMLPEGAPAEGWDHIEIFGEGFHSRAITNPAPWTWSESHMRWPLNLEIYAEGGMLHAILRNFLRACRGGKVPPGCTVEDALQVQIWIEKLIASANSR